MNASFLAARVKETGRFSLWANLRALLFGLMMIAGCADPVGVVPPTYQLQQNYPNPFQDTTRIDYGIPGTETSDIELIVYDINKAQVRVLVDNYFHPPGSFSVVWDGRDDSFTRVPKGLYLIELSGPTGRYDYEPRAYRRIIAIKN